MSSRPREKRNDGKKSKQEVKHTFQGAVGEDAGEGPISLRSVVPSNEAEKIYTLQEQI